MLTSKILISVFIPEVKFVIVVNDGESSIFQSSDTLNVASPLRNLTPPASVVGSEGLTSTGIEGLAVCKASASIEGLAECKASPSIEGLVECKASTSNLRRIQVRAIVKEVEDYLKTYSSAVMDMS
ncbi:hypothetical protein Tco_1305015, partial [Tanacetum coccineum]